MHAYAFANTQQIKYSALVFSRKLAVVAAAAFHSSCGWWKPRAFPFPPASRKRYRYRSYASYDDDTNGSTNNFSITKANSYQLRVKSPEEMVRFFYNLVFFFKKKNPAHVFILVHLDLSHEISLNSLKLPKGNGGWYDFPSMYTWRCDSP